MTEKTILKSGSPGTPLSDVAKPRTISFQVDVPPLSICALRERLKDKGIEMRDAGEAEEADNLLQDVGYCRLMRYLPGLMNAYGNQISMANLNRALTLDNAVRSILFNFICQFERLFKARLAFELAREFGAFAHLSPAPYVNEKECRDLHAKFRQECVTKTRAGSIFVEHHVSAEGRLPVWAAMEIASFSTVRRVYANLKPCKTRGNLAGFIGFDAAILRSVLNAFSFVRNECAHGGPFFGRLLEEPSRMLRELDGLDNRTAFYQIALLLLVFARQGRDVDAALCKSLDHVLSNASSRELAAFGFPEHWKKRALKLCHEGRTDCL